VSDARIHDRGYRPYTGPRAGVPGAVRSVAIHGFRSVLGLGRGGRHKVFPVLAIVIAFLPAIVFVGLAALFPVDLIEDAAVSYSDYLGYVGVALVLFCGLAAPEVLARDRRDGMLPLYLSTPLRRDTYLLAKALAVTSVLCIVTIGPPLLQLLGYTFEGVGPDGVDGWLTVFVRVVVSGVVLSLLFASVSLAAASLTDRRAFASTGIILVLFGGLAVIDALVEAADGSSSLYLLSVLGAGFELVFRIYGEPGEFPEVSTALVAAATLGWTLAGVAVVAWRYRRMTVV